MVCNMDCLNCVFDDCINDTLTAADYRAARELDEFIRPKTRREKQIAARKREYREANREQIAAKQKCIAALRRKKGYTQRDVAKLIGVSRQLFALWEQGRSHAHWDKLAVLFPELKEGCDGIRQL